MQPDRIEELLDGELAKRKLTLTKETRATCIAAIRAVLAHFEQAETPAQGTPLSKTFKFTTEIDGQRLEHEQVIELERQIEQVTKGPDPILGSIVDTLRKNPDALGHSATVERDLRQDPMAAIFADYMAQVTKAGKTPVDGRATLIEAVKKAIEKRGHNVVILDVNTPEGTVLLFQGDPMNGVLGTGLGTAVKPPASTIAGAPTKDELAKMMSLIDPEATALSHPIPGGKGSHLGARADCAECNCTCLALEGNLRCAWCLTRR